MRAIRVWAVLALALLVAYQLLRRAAGTCTGANCDYYIPVSLVVPIAIEVLNAITGGLAVRDARANGHRWLAPLAIAVALGLLGPVATVAIFRDQPDVVVGVGTVLFAVIPVAALAYTYRPKVSP